MKTTTKYAFRKKLYAVVEYERDPVPQDKLKGSASFWGMYAGEHTAGTEFVIGPLFVAHGVSAIDLDYGLLIGNLLAVLSWAFFTAPIATKSRITLYFQLEKIAGSDNPFELFDIFTKIVSVGSRAENIAYMIDQSHTIEPKLEAMIQSVINCQIAYAKALILDYSMLAKAQQAGDVLGAHRILVDAFETDVRPLLSAVREEMGLHPNPIIAHHEDDYQKEIANERGMEEAGGGYPV